MSVELYVYDLSMGLARQYSLAMTGIQIDAIYHTAIVFNNVEYFFGQGIHRKVPGSTHHGRPISVIKLGTTDLPFDVIDEYIQSLETIYTAESYDLFLHNCNNFSQDLAMFLVGKSIPDDIRNLPETFLSSPIGQMLRGQIDQSMRTMTQAPDAVAGRCASSNKASKSNVGPIADAKFSPAAFTNGRPKPIQPGHVYNVTGASDVESLLKQAERTCAVLFFTSATCAPCKIVYPAYDELAAEASDKAVLIKVDISQAYDVAMRYQVRATPAFITFLKGKKNDEWKGANEAQLRGNVRLLMEMANPHHAHTKLRLPNLQNFIQTPNMYTRTPPLAKLVTKLGPSGHDKDLQELVDYIKRRTESGMAQTPLPNMTGISHYIASTFSQLPTEVRFAIIDLIRVAAADPRVSSFLVTEAGQQTLLTVISPETDYGSVSYNVQVVTLQLACNLFGSNVFQEQILNQSCRIRIAIQRLAADCLLARHSNARSLAAALIYNLAAIDHNERMEGRPDVLDLGSADELEAALVEAVVNESENKESLHALLLSLGLLLYMAPTESTIWDLCNVMDVRATLKEKAKLKIFSGEPLLKEIGEELLAKGGP